MKGNAIYGENGVSNPMALEGILLASLWVDEINGHATLNASNHKPFTVGGTPHSARLIVERTRTVEERRSGASRRIGSIVGLHCARIEAHDPSLGCA